MTKSYSLAVVLGLIAARCLTHAAETTRTVIKSYRKYAPGEDPAWVVADDRLTELGFNMTIITAGMPT